MASPPHIPSLNIPNPRKRTSISSISSTAKKRKPSNLRNSFAPDAGSAAGSPLRHSRSPSVGSVDTASLVNGIGGKKRKKKDIDAASVAGSSVRGGKQQEGIPANGDEGVEGDDGEEEDDLDDDDTLLKGDNTTEASRMQEQQNARILVAAMDTDQESRYTTYRRIKLRPPIVRRLVNQTLSQSVPPNVIIAVTSYSKAFIGELVDRALTVRDEWQAARTHAPNPNLDPRVLLNGLQEPFGHRPGSKPTNAHIQHASLWLNQIDRTEGFWKEISKDAALQERLKQCDKGPLTPAHLREALRRYKRGREGGGAGFAGLSLEGPERTLARTGGKKLFR